MDAAALALALCGLLEQLCRCRLATGVGGGADRVLRGYVADPKKRFPGLFIQALAVTALALGAFGLLIYLVLV